MLSSVHCPYTGLPALHTSTKAHATLKLYTKKHCLFLRPTDWLIRYPSSRPTHTFPASSSLVSITKVADSCSQIIRQKSSKVSGIGAWVAM